MEHIINCKIVLLESTKNSESVMRRHATIEYAKAYSVHNTALSSKVLYPPIHINFFLYTCRTRYT